MELTFHYGLSRRNTETEKDDIRQMILTGFEGIDSDADKLQLFDCYRQMTVLNTSTNRQNKVPPPTPHKIGKVSITEGEWCYINTKFFAHHASDDGIKGFVVVARDNTTSNPVFVGVVQRGNKVSDVWRISWDYHLETQQLREVSEKLQNIVDQLNQK